MKVSVSFTLRPL